jgi:hypothetical protein
VASPKVAQIFRPAKEFLHSLGINPKHSAHNYALNADYNTAKQKKNNFLVPWFLGLFLWLFGPLIQKITLDRPHQL